DVLAKPMIKMNVGDVTKVGLRKLPYGPNTQIARHSQVPLLDIGTMDEIKRGHITVHGDIERLTADGVVFTDGSPLDLAAIVLATGYRPGISEFLTEWEKVCDSNGIPK